MRIAAATLVLAAFLVTPLSAQRGAPWQRERPQGVPPGHLPPPGACRVWYDGVPPGQQPPPTSCAEAEWRAARDRYARVIYGDVRVQRGDGWWERDDRGRGRGRAVPRPSGYPYPGARVPGAGAPYDDDRGAYRSLPFENGYRDGQEKGREDARDRDAYDPVRHGWYRSASRGYERGFGSKAAYAIEYRDGFLAGYDAGYRDAERYRSGRGRLPWRGSPRP